MKKILSAAAAGVLFFSTANAVFAVSTIQGNRGTKTNVVSVTTSNSGLNKQRGGNRQSLITGEAYSESRVLSVTNLNGIGSSTGNVTQRNFRTNTKVLSITRSNSGLNKQAGKNNGSQRGRTGAVESNSSVASWANINLVGITLN